MERLLISLLVFYSSAARLLPIGVGIHTLTNPGLSPLTNPGLNPIVNPAIIPVAARLAALRARVAALVSFISMTLMLIHSKPHQSIFY